MLSNTVLRKRIVAVEVPAATAALVVCASQLHLALPFLMFLVRLF
jgi:hypothetical protein